MQSAATLSLRKPLNTGCRRLPDSVFIIYFTVQTIVMSSALQTLNKQNKAAEWASWITECRNSVLSVREWCNEHNICTQTYYRWQKCLFELAKAQQEVQFVEVNPVLLWTQANLQPTALRSDAG